ncbi:hypothetical protein [Nocardioides panzhihuensis]|uniref:Uncharacterized protein n=1 Tax=Nocardioides panzhihuensis TaxID=860243 RepID=A0A7Z0IQL1_9ACTN|nr:hypothetical protein [Nocardioides panzhihuensis]NYI75845.1 hypothetical protein [Nocardioides panzhihuensis]
MTGEVIWAVKTTEVLYERDRPGALVHVDIKKGQQGPDGGNWKAHGPAKGKAGKQKAPGSAAATSTLRSMTAPGWPTPRPSWTRGLDLCRVHRSAADYFATHGMTQIERVITDNHFCYRRSNDVRETIAAVDARHNSIKPHRTASA